MITRLENETKTFYNSLSINTRQRFKEAIKQELLFSKGNVKDKTKEEINAFLEGETWMHNNGLSLNDIPDDEYLKIRREVLGNDATN